MFLFCDRSVIFFASSIWVLLFVALVFPTLSQDPIPRNPAHLSSPRPSQHAFNLTHKKTSEGFFRSVREICPLPSPLTLKSHASSSADMRARRCCRTHSHGLVPPAPRSHCRAFRLLRLPLLLLAFFLSPDTAAAASRPILPLTHPDALSVHGDRHVHRREAEVKGSQGRRYARRSEAVDAAGDGYALLDYDVTLKEDVVDLDALLAEDGLSLLLPALHRDHSQSSRPPASARRRADAPAPGHRRPDGPAAANAHPGAGRAGVPRGGAKPGLHSGDAKLRVALRGPRPATLAAAGRLLHADYVFAWPSAETAAALRAEGRKSDDAATGTADAVDAPLHRAVLDAEGPRPISAGELAEVAAMRPEAATPLGDDAALWIVVELHTSPVPLAHLLEPLSRISFRHRPSRPPDFDKALSNRVSRRTNTTQATSGAPRPHSRGTSAGSPFPLFVLSVRRESPTEPTGPRTASKHASYYTAPHLLSPYSFPLNTPKNDAATPSFPANAQHPRWRMTLSTTPAPRIQTESPTTAVTHPAGEAAQTPQTVGAGRPTSLV